MFSLIFDLSTEKFNVPSKVPTPFVSTVFLSTVIPAVARSLCPSAGTSSNENVSFPGLCFTALFTSLVNLMLPFTASALASLSTLPAKIFAGNSSTKAHINDSHNAVYDFFIFLFINTPFISTIKLTYKLLRCAIIVIFTLCCFNYIYIYWQEFLKN